MTHTMLGDDFRSRIQEVLSCPTAPFAEGAVHRVLWAAAGASPRLRARTDAWGNLEMVYGRGRPRLLFACHTDHPALRYQGGGRAVVEGGIRPETLRSARIRSFAAAGAPDEGVSGRVTRVYEDRRPLRVEVSLEGRVPRGAPLILDLPGVRFGGGWIRARAIDDLLAVAACLTTFDRLARAGFDGCVGALFTRAEEVGLVGALGWARSTRFPKSTTIVNLEMSKALRHTPPGNGPVLRVGDRVGTFSVDVALDLAAAAAGLSKRSPDFKSQRALMDGGGCEALVYADAGFRTGALCLPARHVHNLGPRGAVREAVRQEDAENMVRWMVAYARQHGSVDGRRDLRGRLDKLFRRHAPRLERTAEEVGGAP